MKKKLLSIFMCLSLIMVMLSGCGKSKDDAEETAAEDVVIKTVGPEDGTHLEMWTFVELHATFYAKMLEKWNADHPDKQIQITFTNYPYSDMHTKMLLACQTGEGAPDLCDIEIGQFPNFLQGQPQFVAMNDYIAPYKEDVVQARLDIYSKDGQYYGIPTHVGATVMYYNTKILEQYGIDYKTIKTWDDYAEAGKKLYEASNGEVTMTSVDTSGSDWLWVAMAEYGEDWTDENGAPTLELQSIKNMIKMQQGWLNDNVAMLSPGGQTDMEEGFANIGDGNIASFPKAMWYMSRFLSYMPDMAGQWAIAPCPVFEEGQPRSVGIGGTGTVVSNQTKSPELAAEFLAYAKLSYDGNVEIWNTLGFDTCNTTIWSDETITRDATNQYISYFVNNPFDTLNEIKDEIGKIKVVSLSPTISDQFNLTVLVNCLQNGADVESEVATAQSNAELEYE